MQIFNLDTGSYMRQTSAKALTMGDKEKKDKYLQTCIDCRSYLTPMVYSADGIPGTEAVAEQQRTDLLLSNKLKQEYLELCGFVRAMMSLSIVSYNTLHLHGVGDKEAYIL